MVEIEEPTIIVKMKGEEEEEEREEERALLQVENKVSFFVQKGEEGGEIDTKGVEIEVVDGKGERVDAEVFFF